jgi:hypothetical protein
MDVPGYDEKQRNIQVSLSLSISFFLQMMLMM